MLVVDRGDHYGIVAGERRWRAAKMAGLEEVPVIIRKYDEKEFKEISLIENCKRIDTNPMETAITFRFLIDEYNYKQYELAEILSMSTTTVSNILKLLKLPKKVQDMVADGLITAGHARALLDVGNPDKQYELAQQIVKENLSIKAVKELVQSAGL